MQVVGERSHVEWGIAELERNGGTDEHRTGRPLARALPGLAAADREGTHERIARCRRMNTKPTDTPVVLGPRSDSRPRESVFQGLGLRRASRPQGAILSMVANRTGHTDSTSNLLLAALPEKERQRLVSEATRMTLAARDVVSQRYQPLDHVYFPLSGMVSLVTTMRDGSTVEMATIGREGMVGVSMMSGGKATSGADGIIQVGGEALRLPITPFQALLREVRTLPLLVSRFSEALFQLVGQSSACNRLHTTDQRLSRWLLMTQDRLDSAELPLTHEFLAQMLGVRRQSVSEAAEELQGRGLIHYRRGCVSVLNRQLLEDTACECYGVIRDTFDGLYD